MQNNGMGWQRACDCIPIKSEVTKAVTWERADVRDNRRLSERNRWAWHCRKEWNKNNMNRSIKTKYKVCIRNTEYRWMDGWKILILSLFKVCNVILEKYYTHSGIWKWLEEPQVFFHNLQNKVWKQYTENINKKICNSTKIPIDIMIYRQNNMLSGRGKTNLHFTLTTMWQGKSRKLPTYRWETALTEVKWSA